MDKKETFIAQYSSSYSAREILHFIEEIDGVELKDFLFINSKLDLDYIVLAGNESNIKQLENKDQIVEIKPDIEQVIGVD